MNEETNDIQRSSTEVDKPLEEVFANRLEFEHNLIGHRMTWLMTLNGFIVSGAALLIANQDKFKDNMLQLYLLLVAIFTVGALCNASCLFSNYWANRAIREASAALQQAWTELKLSDEERDRRCHRMRLYGRDPRSFSGNNSRLPSENLHPWMLLPAVFWVAYSVVPLIYLIVEHGWFLGGRWGYAAFVAPMAFVLFFTVPIALDWRHHKKCEVIELVMRSISDSKSPRKERAENSANEDIYLNGLTWGACRSSYREVRRVVRKWAREENGKNKLTARIEVPWMLGRIPKDTLDKYESSNPGKLGLMLPDITGKNSLDC